MSTRSTSNMSAVYVDLGTATLPEYAMYGGQDSISYFWRTIQKCNWASFIQLSMSITGGSLNFNNQFTVEIPRSPDYLMNAWFRVTMPAVTLNITNPDVSPYRLRWTRNLAHNLFREIQVNIGDSSTTLQRVYPEILDFWTMHTVPAGKRVAYDNMIGNINDVINPIKAGASGISIPSFVLNLPLPFFFSRDTGLALPCSTMNYTPIRLWCDVNDWTNLLIVDDFDLHFSRPAAVSDLVTVPTIQQFEAWGEFAVVSGPERKGMGKNVRDMLIDNFQMTSRVAVSGSTPQIQLTFSQSVRALFFGLKNVTNPADGSNYTAAQPLPWNKDSGVNFSPANAVDPIASTTLRYDSVERFTNFPSDFFSLLMPYYHAPVAPRESGYHYYPYSIFLTATDPMCSTNFTKLSNIFLLFNLSQQAIDGMAVTPANYGVSTPSSSADYGQPYKQVYQAFCIAYAHMIIRVMGGTITFPLS